LAWGSTPNKNIVPVVPQTMWIYFRKDSFVSFIWFSTIYEVYA
jgi:hypothetical protein